MYFVDYYKRDYARAAKNKRQRKYQAKNGYPERNKLQQYQAYLKFTYGLTLDQYKEMLCAQGFRCAICRKSHKVFKKKLAVDHNHRTGKIRGLLCHHCNSALGNFKDHVLYLQSAVKYLDQHK